MTDNNEAVEWIRVAADRLKKRGHRDSLKIAIETYKVVHGEEGSYPNQVTDNILNPSTENEDDSHNVRKFYELSKKVLGGVRE